jgi:MFS family permease
MHSSSTSSNWLNSRFTGLWRQPDFMRLWMGQTVSAFGSWLGALSLLAILVLEATPAQMGVLEAVRAAPALLIGLFAGVWVDRLRRRPILMTADIGRFLLLGLVVLAAFAGILQMTWLYVAAFLVGCLTVLFNIAYRSYVPALVSRQRLVAANSKLSASESLAEITAPGLGGLLVQLISAPLTLLLDAVTFLASAVFLRRIQTAEPLPESLTQQSVRQEIGAGLRYVWQERSLRALILAAATRDFFGNFFAALYALYVLRQIGLSPALLGILVGSGGIGALAGATLVGRVTRRWGTGRTLIRAILFTGIVGLLVPLAGSFPRWTAAALLLAGQLIGDVGMSIYLITGLSLRQTLAPDAMLGRVNASFEFLVGGMGTMGIFVGGVLGQTVGIRPSLLIAVSGAMLSCLWLLFSPVRDSDQEIRD